MKIKINRTIKKFELLEWGDWFMMGTDLFMKIAALNGTIEEDATIAADIFNAVDVDGYPVRFAPERTVQMINLEVKVTL